MASTLNKRHQARNEKTLQDLIKTVPGNDRCADCDARNPGWASWSLGTFLCMRCASLHRKLGTHISKVKSLSMDSWSTEQVEVMKKVGNVNSNKVFNPQSKKPRVPLDVDEVDSAMERFIRQKYEQKALSEGAVAPRAAPAPATQTFTGGTASSDDQPPPPPPKPGKRFGFGLRSTASAMGIGRSKNVSRKTSTTSNHKVFGTAMGVTEEGMEWKLVALRDMGFPDDQRNTSILKGLNGDLERAIESLVRLGEGGYTANVTTPVSSKFPSRRSSPPISAGASVRKASSAQPVPLASHFPSQTVSSPTSTHSYNPFENITPAAVPAQQQQQQQQLEGSMQSLNLGLSRPQPQTHTQQLFPNSTGGYPNHSQIQQTRLQHSMTPPMPQVPEYSFFNNPYAQQQQQQPQQQHQQAFYNPFVNNSQQQELRQQSLPPNPFMPPLPNLGSQNPFMQQNNLNAFMSTNNQNQAQISAMPPIQEQQYMQQQPQQYFQQQFQQPVQQQQQMQHPQQQQMQQSGQQQPWMQQPMANSPTQYSYPQYPQTQQSNVNPYQQPMQAQPTGRADNSSILALYNYPQLAPARPQQQEPNGANISPTTASPPPPAPQAAKLPPGVTGGAQRSVTMPVSSGSKNPFVRPAANGMAPQAEGGYHGYQESVDGGRHSPDAFASLSARFVR